jgi:hypothetical protein
MHMMDHHHDLPSLESLVGKQTVARISALDEQKPVVVKIVGVETAGIWVENQKFMEDMMADRKLTATPKTVVFFIPFTGIAWLTSFVDYPSLSEKGLLGE